MNTPHDALYKATFSDPRLAAEALRRALPAAAVARIDWDTLEQVPNDYIGDDLTDRRADLVFRARLDGEPVFLFLLFEHQSTIDPLMPFRAQVYVVRIQRAWLRENPGARRLPAVLPVVLYHGQQPWTSPAGLLDVLDLPDPLKGHLAPHLPSYRLLIDDLTRSTEAEIEASTRISLATAALLALRSAHRLREGAVSQRLLEHLNIALRTEETAEGVVQALNYIYSVGDVPPGSIEARISEGVSDEKREAIMSTAERLRNEGRAEGWAEGRVEMLLRYIEARAGCVPAASRARIEAADEQTLDRWTTRLFARAALAPEDLPDLLA